MPRVRLAGGRQWNLLLRLWFAFLESGAGWFLGNPLRSRRGHRYCFARLKMMTATAPSPATLPVLLAESAPGDEELFRGALQRTGYCNALHAVHNREEAIGYLQGDGRYANRAVFPLPQLLVLNPKTPGKNDWEILQSLRERPAFFFLLVVMFGGSGTLAEEDMAYRLGVNHYHLRPRGADEFTKAIKRIADVWLARNLSH